MAAKHFYPHCFVLLLFYFTEAAALDRRFSDFKRCTDQECSMLLCRGKAVKDFSGPDCRFLSFKKSETVYVYYKLSGKRADLWAGSVGNNFGYFPKDLLAVNHLYTDKELEVPAQETDFVCFDTGFDKFDNYDIDLLLGSSLEVNDNENKESSESEPHDTPKETQQSAVDTGDSENPFENHENSEDLKRNVSGDKSTLDAANSKKPTELHHNTEDLESNVPDDQSASLSELDVTPKPAPANAVESVGAGNSNTVEQAAGDAKVEQKNTVKSFPENVVSERTETKDASTVSEVEPVPEDQSKKFVKMEPVSISEGLQIPDLKTTLGTTFDAVTTDEEITKKVTPYEEEESKGVENPPKDEVDVKEEIPLLTFSEESVNPTASDIIKQQEIPLAANSDKPKTTDDQNMQISPEDTVISVVTGKEATAEVLSSEDDDHDDLKKEENEEDEQIEKAATKTVLEEAKTDVHLLTTKSPQEPENLDPSISSSVQLDNKDSGHKNEKPLIDNEQENDGEVIQENDLNESLKESHEPMKTQTESSVKSVNPQGHSLANADAEKSKLETTHQPVSEEKEEKVSNDLGISSVTKDKEQEVTRDSVISEDNAHKDKLENNTSNDSQISKYNDIEGKEIEVMFSDSEINEGSPNEEEEEEVEVTENSEISEGIATEDEEEEEVLDNKGIATQEEEEEVSDNPEISEEITTEEEGEEEEEEEEVSDNSEINQRIASEDEENVSNNSEINEEIATEDKKGEEEVSNNLDIDDEIATDVEEAEEMSDNSEINEEIAAEVEEEEEEVADNSETSEDNAGTQDSSDVVEHKKKLDNVLEKIQNKIVTNQESAVKESDNSKNLSTTKIESNVIKTEEKTADASIPDDINKSSLTDLASNNSQQKTLKEPETPEELHIETEDKNDINMEEDHNEQKELLEDENALLFAQTVVKDSDKASAEAETLTAEPEYSDSILRLTLLREHFNETQMQRYQKHLGLKNLVKVEAMFSDLDTELQATRLSHSGNTQDIENALENILEASENTILDEIEKMLDNKPSKQNDELEKDTSSLDEETEILDDFQELGFSLLHKYSTASDSAPLATEKASDIKKDEHSLLIKEDMTHFTEEDKGDSVLEPDSDGNLTEASHKKKPADTQEKPKVVDKGHTIQDVSVEEDSGRFNKNEDNQPGFTDSDKMQKVPQATLENPLDMGLGVEVDNSQPSGSLEAIDPVSEIHDKEVGSFTSGIVYLNCVISTIKSKIEEWTTVMISLMPEEWKPGPTLFGCPWQAVVITALVGVVTFLLFFWRTVLAIKKREYLVDEKKLTEQIQALIKEKNEAQEKMSELQKQTEQLKENQKQSKETVSSTVKIMQALESKVLEAETRNEEIVREKNTYAKLLEEERTNSQQNLTRIEKLEKANEKLQLSRKKIQEALAKTTVLLDEAKIREDARNVNQKCLEKEYATVKEENKTLKVTIKEWEDKHKKLSEQIKVYHKSQKELEDSVVLKDHNVEVLSELLADLEACDLQKGETKLLANGEIAPDKKTAIKNRIKQMMDVSRVQTTLSVVEEERDRFMSKLLDEEKARKALEEQHQELEHAIATLKSDKSHVENQFKILQQKNEIMVEMYQQKENALQQRLTKEELERRSKENLLSEVGGKALEVEEQVKILRQRISEMEDQMKKTEELYKEQIKEQENKTHTNWVNARNAERALNQEKLECSKLREKLAVLTSQLNERRAPLFRPNSRQPAGPRPGDSYGPSPVSGGAPSPPIMIEGPRRPPSAPVGRRIDPYGPRPPSDPQGRYPDNKHMGGMDMMGPRSSSPANMDASGPGSFLASPIRDSPGPINQGPPLVSLPHDPMIPPGPPVRLPPPGLYRPPRPGLYPLPPGPQGPLQPPLHGPPLPANGHPGMPLPGPMGGEFGPRPTNGHAFHPRPGPGPFIDSRGPPPHFRPPLPHHLGPMSTPTGVRGPIGPRPPIPPDVRFPGPRDHTSPPMDMTTGFPLHPADAYGQAPTDAHSGPGQDLHVKQEAPQDSVRPAMVKP